MGLEELKRLHPWPEIKPSLAFDPHGWFGWCHKAVLDAVLKKESKYILELGAWLGSSTRYLLSNTSGVVITIDAWENGGSSIAFDADKVALEKIKCLYDQFTSNCWHFKDRLIPIKNNTIDGMLQVKEAGIIPEIIYLDANHTYESVSKDLDCINKLFPSSILVGDDYGGKWDGVKKAIDEYATKNGFATYSIEQAWILSKETETLRESLSSFRDFRYKEMELECLSL